MESGVDAFVAVMMFSAYILSPIVDRMAFGPLLHRPRQISFLKGQGRLTTKRFTAVLLLIGPAIQRRMDSKMVADWN